jgi:hypothetical protein
MKILYDIACNLYWMEFKFNWKEMGCKLMQKVLKKIHDYDIKKTLKIHRFKRAHFHPSLLLNKLNKF